MDTATDTSAQAPQKPAAPLLQHQAYWILAIAFLLALNVYQAFVRHTPEIRESITLALPAYANAQVSVDAGDYAIQELLTNLAAQSHVTITLLPAPEGAALDNALKKKITLKHETATLAVMLGLLGDSVDHLAIDYEKNRVVMGDRDSLTNSDRCIVVIYPVADLLFVNSPFSGYSTKIQRLTNLEELIRHTVAPDTWRDSTTVVGTIGTIRNVDDNLVVMTTPAYQCQIEALLSAIRAK